jgi:hypothetical protein
MHCCVAFVTAFVLAPFQHVHRDGVHPPVVHSHLYPHHHDHADHHHVDKPGEREIESADEEQVSSLDTFTPVLIASFSPFIPSRAPALPEPPAGTRASFELVEERGHDPPARRNSSPRAPPA